MEKKNTYCPKTGLEGSERLLILNETYNPSTFDLISEWAKPGMRVLELGCGLGLISNHLAECVGNEGSVLAIDNCGEQLELARSNCRHENRVSFQKLDVHDLEFLDGQFDLIYSRFLMMHLTDVESIIQKFSDRIKAGGVLIVEEPTELEKIGCEPAASEFELFWKMGRGQFSMHSTDNQIGLSLGDLLQSEGFDIISESRNYPELSNPRLRKQLRLCVDELEELIEGNNLMSGGELKKLREFLSRLEHDDTKTVHYFELSQIAARLERSTPD